MGFRRILIQLASQLYKHFKCMEFFSFYLNWILPTFFSLSHVSNSPPPTHGKSSAREMWERKFWLLMLSCVCDSKAPFSFPFFVLHHSPTWLFLLSAFIYGFAGGSLSLFPFISFFPSRLPKWSGGCFALNRKNLVMANNTPRKKTYLYFIIDWIPIFFWRTEKKH